MRNEVKHFMSLATADRVRAGVGPLYCVEDDRTQRYTVPLVDVDYVFVARAIARAPGEDLRKHVGIFNDRVAGGACFQQPYFGIREYWARFGPATRREQPIPETKRLGSMLFDLSYDPQQRGRGTPIFFDAVLSRGILHVPTDLYQQVYGFGRASDRTHPGSAARGATRCAHHTAHPAATGSRGLRAQRDCRDQMPGDRRWREAHTTPSGRSHAHSAPRPNRDALLAVAWEKLSAAPPEVRGVWCQFYLFLQSAQNLSQVRQWARGHAGRGGRMCAREAATYTEILTLVGEE